MLTEEHYEQLLGLRSPWSVTNVDLNMEKLQVDIYVEHVGQTDVCPACGAACKVYDQAAERTWRHLDTMQFETLLHAKTPRVECPQHGVKTVSVPWAGKHARFTLLFEAFAVRVLLAARSVEEARKLLRLNWHQVEAIKKRAVERGLNRRKNSLIPYIGLDEKSFRKGMSFVTTCCDLENARVLDVTENRDEQSTKSLLKKALSKSQLAGVFAASMDMWAAYRNATNEVLPFTEIVHDRFHVCKHLNEAVDKVRRQEHRQMLLQGDDNLKGTKYWWLKNEPELTDDALARFEELKKAGLKVARAWEIKQLFRHFWTSTNVKQARTFFEKWYIRAIHCRLNPIKKVAKMIKKHLENLLNVLVWKISNGVVEGINSKIQTVKSNARGYRSFESYRTAILFHCGKLKMLP
jgi:transposase